MNDTKKYLIVFDGPKDSSEDTLRRIKACFLADLELPISEISRIFVDPPSEVITVASKEIAKKFHVALTAAGAKVRVEIVGEDEDYEEDGDEEEDTPSMELTVDTSEGKEEKPAKVWELSIDDEDPEPEPESNSQETEEEDQVDLTIPEDEPQAPEVPKESPQFNSGGISLEGDDDEVSAAPPPPPPPPAPKPVAPPVTEKKDQGTQIILRPEVEEPKAKPEPPKKEKPVAALPPEETKSEEEVTPRVLNKWSGIANPAPKAEPQPSEDGSKATIIPTSSTNLRRGKSKKTKLKEFMQLIIPFAILQIIVTVSFFYLSGSDADKTDDILTVIEESEKDLPGNPAIPTKEPTATATATPEGPVTPFTAQVEKDNSSFSFDCEIEVTKLRNCIISVTTSQPPELIPEEIVRGTKRAPWVTRIESDAANFVDGSAKSEARAFIDYDGRKDRVKANVFFTTKSVLGSNQKLLEVTILSGTETPLKEDSHFLSSVNKDGIYVLSIRQSTKLPVAKDPGIVVPEMTPLPTIPPTPPK